MYSGNAFKLLKTNVQREKSMEIDCWPQIWQLREATRRFLGFSGFTVSEQFATLNIYEK